MKLATYEYAGKTCVGAVDTDSGFVVDLAAASGGQAFFDSMLTLIRAGEEGMQATRAVTASAGSQHRRRLANIRLMAPLPLPEQIRDFLVFPDHITQSAIGLKRLAAQMEGLPPPRLTSPEDLFPLLPASGRSAIFQIASMSRDRTTRSSGRATAR